MTCVAWIIGNRRKRVDRVTLQDCIDPNVGVDMPGFKGDPISVMKDTLEEARVIFGLDG